MVLTLAGRFGAIGERARHLVAIGLTVVLFLLLVAGIASTYVGHSRSPYDTCVGANGRAIACATLEAARATR
jgi:hypothetical protein